MYANLYVTAIPADDPVSQPQDYYCHAVEISNGRIVLHLDDPEDQSSYACPAGELEVVPPILITACY